MARPLSNATLLVAAGDQEELGKLKPDVPPAKNRRMASCSPAASRRTVQATPSVKGSLTSSNRHQRQMRT